MRRPDRLCVGGPPAGLRSTPDALQGAENHAGGNAWVRAGVCSAQGARRSNEDAHVLNCDWRQRDDRGGPPAALFAVLDGHGGGQVALHASRCLGEEMQQELDVTGWATEDARRGAAECAFLSLDRRIARELGMQGVRSCGSTCVAAATWPEERGIFRMLIANIGDSRALVVRCASGSGGLIFESTDHKPDSPAEMRRIREAGGRVTGGAVGDAAGAFCGPARVDGGLACARALGDTGMKADPSRPPERQKISALPDVYDLVCRPGDVLLLACDGVFDVMTARISTTRCGRVVRPLTSSLPNCLAPGMAAMVSIS